MRRRSLTSWIFFCPRANSKFLINDTNYNTYPNSNAISNAYPDPNDIIDTRSTCSYQCEH
jgi:hypothetical protein